MGDPKIPVARVVVRKKEVRAQGASLGCSSLVEDAIESGASPEDIAVSLDKLEESGYDAFVQFLSDQTNGQYPPRGRQLRSEIPQEVLDGVKGSYQVYRKVWWDCLTFSSGGPPVQQMTRLFGNANVGLLVATNLQVAGQLAFDGPVYIAGWSVTTNASPEEKPLVDALLSSGFAHFSLGDHRLASRRMADLFQEASPIEHTCPERQNLSVEMEFYDGSIQRFNDAFTSEIGRPLRVWINLEGWAVRRGY